MVKVKVYNLEGKEVKEENINLEIFGIEVNEALVHQAIITGMANCRAAIAHAKDRSEVRGGGRKPWKQKGTGRARHGSIRSPLWVGGGVTFGPTKERNFSKKINKKSKRKALFMSLSDKVANNNLILIDELKLDQIKTKKMAEILTKLPVSGKVLLVLPESDEKVFKSARNLASTLVLRADNLNIYNVVDSDCLLMPVASVKKIEETYLKK